MSVNCLIKWRGGFPLANFSNTEDYSQCSSGPNGPGFLSWAQRTMYYWYKIAFYDETPEDKCEAETISVDYIIFSYF